MSKGLEGDIQAHGAPWPSCMKTIMIKPVLPDSGQSIRLLAVRFSLENSGLEYFHAEPNLALLVDFENLDSDHVTFRKHITHFIDPPVRDL